MVSWRLWVYIPIFIIVALNIKEVFIIPMAFSIYLLIYGLIKIFTRQCFRKYTTFILGIVMLSATVFLPFPFWALTLMLFLMIFDAV
ncbi:MAG: hypothetical protein HZB65_01960 [Candidatus Aenigmarchaeota archaeon]|nr:hypothetical protein [Candidatus Aenigmarchaeota archaeon]